MKTQNKKQQIEEQIVRRIEASNPYIGVHLANNMKDYILYRIKEDFE